MGNIKLGPDVYAQFVVKLGSIERIVLSHHPQKGFGWQVEGDGKDSGIKDKVDRWVTSYCRKEHADVALPCSMEAATPFVRQVLEELHNLPFGKICTYQQLAEVVGSPRGARAVGMACGKNPYPLVIPCHRVVAAKGLGGYSAGGHEVKGALLAFEGCGQ